MTYAVFWLACLAAEVGEWYRAATLHGAAQALLDQTRRTETGQRAKSLDQIAAAIGDKQLKQAYEQGSGFRISHAIDLALGKPGPI